MLGDEDRELSSIDELVIAVALLGPGVVLGLCYYLKAYDQAFWLIPLSGAAGFFALLTVCRSLAFPLLYAAGYGAMMIYGVVIALSAAH